MRAYGEYGIRGYIEWVVRNRKTWNKIKRSQKRSERGKAKAAIRKEING